MAFKGTAGKSSSGASMSKYDVEVEARLKKLEAAVKELQNHSHDAPGVDAEALHQVKNEIFEASKAMSNVGSFETKLGKLAAAVETATGKRIRLDEE